MNSLPSRCCVIKYISNFPAVYSKNVNSTFCQYLLNLLNELGSPYLKVLYQYNNEHERVKVCISNSWESYTLSALNKGLSRANV